MNQRAKDMIELTQYFIPTMERFVQETADFYGCERDKAIRLIEIWLEEYREEPPEGCGLGKRMRRNGHVWDEAKEKCSHIVHTEIL